MYLLENNITFKKLQECIYTLRNPTWATIWWELLAGSVSFHNKGDG
jgi:hypothetical protein